MNTKSIFALILTLSFLTACAQPTSLGVYPPPVSLPVTPTNIAVYPGPTAVPTDVASAPTHIPVDLTPAQLAAIQALSKKYNLPIDQIKIVSIESVTWPSGCLGVVIPSVMCTDMIVDGFRVIMAANGQQYEFHTDQDGTNVVDAAQQLASLGFVVYTSDRIIQVVKPNIPLGSTYNPAFNGLLPVGGYVAGTAYVLDINQSKAIAINADGAHDLNFIQKPTYGLAIWRGGLSTSPLLAWGTQTTDSTTPSSLQISAPDGSRLETLLTLDRGTNPPLALVAEFWSADGQSLYFSKEPIGLGGYILFSGASNLFQINITTKQVAEIIPLTPDTGPQACLDAISGDYRFVADHCTQNVITIRDLQTGTSTAIQAPSDVTEYQVMGSARFSPMGDRVAFALAKRDPDNERGWVALGNSSGGEAKLILVGDAGSYYTVLGWLDGQTLLVQSNTIGNPNIGSQLFTVGTDGSNLTKVADGSLLSILDNR